MVEMTKTMLKMKTIIPKKTLLPQPVTVQWIQNRANNFIKKFPWNWFIIISRVFWTGLFREKTKHKEEEEKHVIDYDVLERFSCCEWLRLSECGFLLLLFYLKLILIICSIPLKKWVKNLFPKFSSPPKKFEHAFFVNSVFSFKKDRERKKLRPKIVLRFVNIIFRILYTTIVHF